MVVLTAALSAYNSGLYANGRMLYSLSKQGNAPKVLSKVNKSGSPYVGVLASSAITAFAVVLAFLFPKQVFLYVISVALIAGIFNWTTIMLTQLKFRKRKEAEGEVDGLQYTLPLYPIANYFVIAFLACIVVLMAMNENYRVAVFVGPVWIIVLAIAFMIKKSMSRGEELHPDHMEHYKH